MQRLFPTLAIAAAPLLLSCATVDPPRGPALAMSGRGPVTERVQTHVRVIDAKLTALEQLCHIDGRAGVGRCSGPLEDLKRRKAYYRQRANALIETRGTTSVDDVAAWQELEIDLELLTIDVDELADDIKYQT